MSVRIKPILPPVKLAESPYWDVKTQTLICIDVFRGRILKYDPVTEKHTTAQLDIGNIYAVVGVEGRSDQFLVTTEKDICLVDWDTKSDVDKPPVKKISSIYTTTGDSFNDAKCDSSGRLWTGTKGEFDDQFNIKLNQGLIYSLGADLKIKEMHGPISLSNGLCWNADETIFYFADTLAQQIWSFDFDVKSGTISNKKVVFDFKERGINELPDGMTIDTYDNLWIACFGGKGIANVDPRTGKMLRFIDMPVHQITSVAFCGPDMDIMYVTTANVPTINLIGVETQGGADAGAVFRIDGLGVKGRPHHNFKIN